LLPTSHRSQYSMFCLGEIMTNITWQNLFLSFKRGGHFSPRSRWPERTCSAWQDRVHHVTQNKSVKITKHHYEWKRVTNNEVFGSQTEFKFSVIMLYELSLFDVLRSILRIVALGILYMNYHLLFVMHVCTYDIHKRSIFILAPVWLIVSLWTV